MFDNPLMATTNQNIKGHNKENKGEEQDGDKQDTNNQLHRQQFVDYNEVQPRKRNRKSNDLDIEELDENQLSEMLAISKKMLRKKDRRDIIEKSYGHYCYPEDPSELPQWFADDEKRHSVPIVQVTKEDIEREKARLYQLKTQLPRKVLEAKYR